MAHGYNQPSGPFDVRLVRPSVLAVHYDEVNTPPSYWAVMLLTEAAHENETKTRCA